MVLQGNLVQVGQEGVWQKIKQKRYLYKCNLNGPFTAFFPQKQFSFYPSYSFSCVIYYFNCKRVDIFVAHSENKLSLDVAL